MKFWKEFNSCSQIIGIKSLVNKDYVIQFNIKSRKDKVLNR